MPFPPFAAELIRVNRDLLSYTDRLRPALITRGWSVDDADTVASAMGDFLHPAIRRLYELVGDDYEHTSLSPARRRLAEKTSRSADRRARKRAAPGANGRRMRAA